MGFSGTLPHGRDRHHRIRASFLGCPCIHDSAFDRFSPQEMVTVTLPATISGIREVNSRRSSMGEPHKLGSESQNDTVASGADHMVDLFREHIIVDGVIRAVWRLENR